MRKKLWVRGCGLPASKEKAGTRLRVMVGMAVHRWRGVLRQGEEVGSSVSGSNGATPERGEMVM
jgi:hypothetical protein